MINYAAFGFVTVLYVIYALFKVIGRIKDSFKIDLNRKRIVFVASCDDVDGRKLVQALDDVGFTVFAGCCTKLAADKIKQTCTDKVFPVTYDATRTSSIDEAVYFIGRNLPGEFGLWAIVLNQRVFKEPSMFEWTSDSETDQIIKVNLVQSILWLRKLLPWVRREKGRVVLTTSFPPTGVPTWVDYDIAVGGIEAMYNSLRQQLVRTEVTLHRVKLPFVNPKNSGKGQQVILEKFNSLPPPVKGYYGEKFVHYMVNQSMNQSRNITDEATRLYVGAVAHMFPRTVYAVDPGWADWFLHLLPGSISEKIQQHSLPVPDGVLNVKPKQ